MAEPMITGGPDAPVVATTPGGLHKVDPGSAAVSGGAESVTGVQQPGERPETVPSMADHVERALHEDPGPAAVTITAGVVTHPADPGTANDQVGPGAGGADAERETPDRPRTVGGGTV
jgi:hypothetical protein